MEPRNNHLATLRDKTINLLRQVETEPKSTSREKELALTSRKLLEGKKPDQLLAKRADLFVLQAKAELLARRLKGGTAH